jgi:hypothetical protein
VYGLININKEIVSARYRSLVAISAHRCYREPRSGEQK